MIIQPPISISEGDHMTGQSDVADRITTALAEYLKRDPKSIRPDYHLRDDLGLDSMAVIELVYRIEEAFNLQIPDEDLPGLTSVQHVIEYVEGRLQPASFTKQPVQPAVRKPAARKPTAAKPVKAKATKKRS
jgi:acyl carrier protein